MERRHQVLENGTLIIKKVVRKDTGMYACSAVNRHGNSATQSGQLNVIGESIIIILMQYRMSQRINSRVKRKNV